MRALLVCASLLCAVRGGLLTAGKVAVYRAFSHSWEFVLTLQGETNEWDRVQAYACEAGDCLQNPFFENPFVACGAEPPETAWRSRAWLQVVPPLSLYVRDQVPGRFAPDGVLTVRVLFRRSLDEDNSTCLARAYDVAFVLPLHEVPLTSFETDGDLCPGMAAPEHGRLVRGAFNTSCLWQCGLGRTRRPWNAVPLVGAELACPRFPPEFSVLLVSVDLLVPHWWTLATLGADFYERVDDLASLLERYLMPVLT